MSAPTLGSGRVRKPCEMCGKMMERHHRGMGAWKPKQIAILDT